ncbi:hypothetical protein NKH18_47740 [Streptomyces sp. M10(2022)]
MSRGAHQVAALADHVIDNSGSIAALRARLRRIAAPPASATLRVATPYGLGLPAAVASATADFTDAVRAYGPGVRLAALTGSPGEGSWIAGWSDLDLLVVAEHEVTDRVHEAVSQYRSALNGAASLGPTLVTPGELTARRLTPRLAFALYQLQQGQPALHAAPDTELPTITRDELALAAVRELPRSSSPCAACVPRLGRTPCGSSTSTSYWPAAFSCASTTSGSRGPTGSSPQPPGCRV